MANKYSKALSNKLIFCSKFKLALKGFGLSEGLNAYHTAPQANLIYIYIYTVELRKKEIKSISIYMYTYICNVHIGANFGTQHSGVLESLQAANLAAKLRLWVNML